MNDNLLISIVEGVREYLPNAKVSEIKKEITRCSVVHETIAQLIEEHRNDK